MPPNLLFIHSRRLSHHGTIRVSSITARKKPPIKAEKIRPKIFSKRPSSLSKNNPVNPTIITVNIRRGSVGSIFLLSRSLVIIIQIIGSITRAKIRNHISNPIVFIRTVLLALLQFFNGVDSQRLECSAAGECRQPVNFPILQHSDTPTHPHSHTPIPTSHPPALSYCPAAVPRKS